MHYMYMFGEEGACIPVSTGALKNRNWEWALVTFFLNVDNLENWEPSKLMLIGHYDYLD